MAILLIWFSMLLVLVTTFIVSPSVRKDLVIAYLLNLVLIAPIPGNCLPFTFYCPDLINCVTKALYLNLSEDAKTISI